MAVSALSNLVKIDSSIPIPSVEYLEKVSKETKTASAPAMYKYAQEFDVFCRWSALPKEIREPKTAVEFEKRHKLPNRYTSYFKTHEEFQGKRLKYFWEWLFDLYPDVVYAVYKRAVKKSAKDAGIFVDIIGKRIDIDKPKMQITPLVIMGLPQDKLDKLFIPKNYDVIADSTPKSL